MNIDIWSSSQRSEAIFYRLNDRMIKIQIDMFSLLFFQSLDRRSKLTDIISGREKNGTGRYETVQVYLIKCPKLQITASCYFSQCEPCLQSALVGTISSPTLGATHRYRTSGMQCADSCACLSTVFCMQTGGGGWFLFAGAELRFDPRGPHLLKNAFNSAKMCFRLYEPDICFTLWFGVHFFWGGGGCGWRH